MQEIQRKDDRTITRVELINPYAHGLTLVDLEVPQSTSADGWKYHKRNKRKKKKKKKINLED